MAALSTRCQLTSFFQFSLVVAVAKPGTFIGKQCHQRLGHHEIGRRHQFVFFCHSSQETGQELPLDWIIYCGQIHPGGSWYQILEEKRGKTGWDQKNKKALFVVSLFTSFSWVFHLDTWVHSWTRSLAALGLFDARQPTAVLRYAKQEMGLVGLLAPRGRSEDPGPNVRPVESPALPAAAKHIRRTRVLMSVKPRDSNPAARLQLEPLKNRNMS